MKNATPADTTPPAGAARTHGSLRIVKVESRSDLTTFLHLPWSLYQDDEQWIPPLLYEQRLLFSPKNPYFDHATCRCWIAFRGRRPVGRISAQIDRLHLDRYDDATGFFGMLEAEDSGETFQAILGTAEDWVQGRGMQRIRGPFNLSINQECGLLVDGFETQPAMMMGHARRYYATRVEQCGYVKEKDLLAYAIDTGVEPSKAMNLILKRTKNTIETRTVSRKSFQHDLDMIFDIFNDAWSDNWGFIPFTRREITHMANDLKLLINERLARIACVDGQPAAFIVLLPNLNEAIADLNGRLFPLGWLKLLWRLKVRRLRTGRILLMGVRKAFQGTALGAALAYRVIGDTRQEVVDLGMKELELSWILEDNIGVQSIIKDCGGREYKRYRIFSRQLSASTP
jgi:hypothetical protein